MTSKLSSLDSSLDSFHSSNQAKASALKQRLENIVKYIEADKAACEDSAARKTDQVRDLEAEMLLRIEAEQAANREMEKRLTYFVLASAGLGAGEAVNLVGVLAKQRFEEVERVKRGIKERLDRLNEQYQVGRRGDGVGGAQDQGGCGHQADQEDRGGVQWPEGRQ